MSYFREAIGIDMSSRIITLTSSRVKPSLRQVFKDSDVENMVSHSFMRNHSHPDAAKLRCYANTAMSNLITALGFKEYSVSRSSSEERVGVEGTRLYYHAKDLQMRVTDDKLTSKHIIKMTDVDYYVPIHQYLTGNNLLLYTFTPYNVAGAGTDYTYRVINGDNIDMHVNGGGHYTHQLWDYETDHAMIDHWWGSCFYLVESKSLSDDRKIIFFNHIRTIYGPLAWLIPGFRIHRKRLCYGNVSYIKSMQQ